MDKVINKSVYNVNNKSGDNFSMGNLWTLLKEQINAEMEAQSVTKAELARRLGWVPQQVSRYLGNEESSEPGLDKMAEMATAINIPLAQLVQKSVERQGKKSGPQVVSTPASRDTMIVKLICDLCEMSTEEIQTISNSVRLMKEKLAAKRSAGKKTSQAG